MTYSIVERPYVTQQKEIKSVLPLKTTVKCYKVIMME